MVTNGALTQNPNGGGTLTTTTTPAAQISQVFNVASVVTDGVDYEASYRFAVDDVLDWGLGGDVTYAPWRPM